MDTLRKLLKLSFFAIVVTFFLSAGYSCKPHKCVANGGEVPKKVNKYRNKPQSGLWDKKSRRR
ncbi:MAG: hypothetical protein ACXWDO_11095 [Bacteroidia bacterium]